MNEEKEKRVVLTPEEKYHQLIERSVDLHDRSLQAFKKVNVLHDKIEMEMRLIKQENTALVTLLNRKFSEQKQVLSKTLKVAEATEDTLLNVLLAIRQKEYLHAWYPEQGEVPEMNVVGRHPSKLKEA